MNPHFMRNNVPHELVVQHGMTTLDELQLSEREQAALCRQGFVAAEGRGRGHIRYKLRFRVDRRQRVRCLGRDPQRADAVREALVVLQAGRRCQRELNGLIRTAGRVLRATKHQLEPALNARGFRFHGLAIRQSRVQKPEAKDR